MKVLLSGICSTIKCFLCLHLLSTSLFLNSSSLVPLIGFPLFRLEKTHLSPTHCMSPLQIVTTHLSFHKFCSSFVAAVLGAHRRHSTHINCTFFFTLLHSSSFSGHFFIPWLGFFLFVRAYHYLVYPLEKCFFGNSRQIFLSGFHI